ncbi:nitrite reductase small subunit NirD [Massilia sp. W12]|uniref:nitrite reductase small subunit NirD n=1 Tax=Massilia sp. W12 TaxID=3126507 RepID=UPI0030D0FFA8
MQNWLEVGSLEHIPLQGARVVEYADLPPLALFRTADDQVYALLDRCPHQGGPLSQGMVFADSVSCPLHNWQIDLKSGQAHAPDVGCTPVVALKLMAGQVYVDAHSWRAAASAAHKMACPQHGAARSMPLRIYSM